MKNFQKSHEEEDAAADSSSSLNRLPDELVLQIFNKLTDLKTLCFCHLISKRFSSIILQVDTITFTAPLSKPNNSDNNNTSGEVSGTGFPQNLFRSLINGVVFKPLNLLRRMVTPSIKPLPPIISSFYGESFRSAVSFLSKFKSVKSLCIQLPSTNHKGIDNSLLFKWKVRLSNRIESFIFLSPNSISDTHRSFVNEDEMEEDVNLFKQKVHIAFQCLKDVIVRHRMLLYFIKDHSLLETISITDSGKRGRLLLSGGKLVEVREWIRSDSDSVKPQMNRIDIPVSVSQCYVPLLNLPVSGCVMQGVTFVVMQMMDLGNGNDGFMNGEDRFEDAEDAAYSEAVMEILENHNGRMKRLL